ncbi:MAG: hypothetical protein AAGI17_06610 [Planctomycetota bacterium]
MSRLNLLPLLVLISFLGLASCGGSSRVEGDPLLNTADVSLESFVRENAARTAWVEAQRGERSLPIVREQFKDLIWTDATNARLRDVMVELLLSDTTPAGDEDNRRLAILRLPLEVEPITAQRFMAAAVDGGWTDVTPALVRRLAEVEQFGGERQEPAVIAALHPGESFERVLFETLLEPEVIPGQREQLRKRRVRRAALDVLGVIDPSGEQLIRMATTASEIERPPEAVAIIRTISRSAESFGVAPRNGRELEWLDRVTSDEDSRNAAWRSQVSAAVRSLSRGKRQGLRLFHLEPIRWASDAKPGWLSATREELVSIVEARLEGRPFNRRTAEIDIDRSGLDERFRDHKDAMAWADLIALLAVDEALRSESFVTRVIDLAQLDREDRTTEYGGLLWAGSALDPTGSRAQLYLPRTGDRLGDTTFIASEDAIRDGDRALAHFHLQVADRRNAEFAGPSGPDLDFAARMGRLGVVFTSIRERRLAVDYYQPNGVVVDLGEIRDN